MRRKIAFIGIKGLPSQAGADRAVEAIVRRIDRNRYQPTVYCSNRVVPKGMRIPGVELAIMPTLPGKHTHATSLFLMSALHALFLGDYDIIHLHNVEASFVLPLLRLRHKVVSTSHGSAQAREKWGPLAKTLIRVTEYPFVYLSNALTSVSEHLANEYEHKYRRKVHFVPTGVDTEYALDQRGAAAILREHGIEDVPYTLFAAGRIIPTKGCHLLLRAFRELQTDHKLLIVGDLEQIPRYSRELRELADDRVRFVPFISAKETLFALIQRAQLYVFPSTVEGMSQVLVEAASLGVPIVCSDIPENVSVLPEHALFFKSSDVTDLRIKIHWAMENREAMLEQAARAADRVSNRYRWDRVVRSYELVYESV